MLTGWHTMAHLPAAASAHHSTLLPCAGGSIERGRPIGAEYGYSENNVVVCFSQNEVPLAHGRAVCWYQPIHRRVVHFTQAYHHRAFGSSTVICDVVESKC